MSGLEGFELIYSGWELLKVVLILFILVTMLRILHELRDLKAGDLRESRRMSRQIHDEHAVLAVELQVTGPAVMLYEPRNTIVHPFVQAGIFAHCHAALGGVAASS